MKFKIMHWFKKTSTGTKEIIIDTGFSAPEADKFHKN
jgi:hypothetical protein